MSSAGQARWLLGAYAASSNLQPWNPQVQAQFWSALADLPELRGLELPFGAGGPEAVWKKLPRQWDFIFTLLPATMQALAARPQFGLASRDPEGFQAALDLAEQARLAIAVLNDHCGRQAVQAVHLHSAPRLGTGDPAQLQRGLQTLLERDWQGAKLLLEHCDAYRPPQAAVKGFLGLQEELAVLDQLKLGMTLNWGRSALEARAAAGALQQLSEVQSRARLGGYMFSGTAVTDPLYGDWQDSHAPIALGSDAPWEPQGGLLGRAELDLACRKLAALEPEFLGLKVQFFPATLSLAQRLAGIEAQVQALVDSWQRAQNFRA